MSDDPWNQFPDAQSATHEAGPAGPPVETRPVPAQTAGADLNDEWGSFQDASVPVVNSDITISGFKDELPPELASKLKPEEVQDYIKTAKTGTARDIENWFAKHGYSISNADDIVKARAEGKGVNDHMVYKPPVVKPATADAAWAHGVGDAVTLGFLDELGAAADVLGFTHGRENIWNSKKSISDLYDRNLDINRSIIHSEEAAHPYARFAGQVTGGAVLPAGIEGVGLRAGKTVLEAGGTMAEARAAAAAAIRNRLMQVGGSYGAAHGAGSAEGGIGDRAVGALEEGAMGAGTAGALGLAGEAIAPRMAARAAEARAAPMTDGEQVAAAAARQDIPVFAPDVGGAGVRKMASAVSQSITGAQPLAQAAGKTIAGAKAARDRIAAAVGDALSPEAAGQDALSGAQKYIAQSRNDARQFYGAAEAASKGLKIQPTKALDAIQQNIDELSETPGGAPGLTTLQGIADEMKNGGVSVTGLRNMRTVLRDQFTRDGLRGSDIERRVNGVIDAASEDVRDGLNSAGLPDAAVNFAKGDAAWKARANTIDTVLKPIIGTRDNPRSGEQIVKTLMADLQGNNARAVRFLNALPETERGNLRASIIAGLGRPAAGAQSADGEGFSLASFLTSWSKIGESAKAAYFGPEGRAALNDIAKVAQGSKEAMRHANHSNTAGNVVGNLLFTLAGQGVGGVKTAGATLVGPYAMGRLLASPRFARWLARAPRSSLSSPAYLDRLSRIARAEPAIAEDVLGMRDNLLRAVNDNITPAVAASDPNENKQKQ